MTGILYEDLHAFLRFEVTDVHHQPGDSSAIYKGQILANKPELLRYPYIS
jgi:hypothetical protein